ncbi:DUF1534 domain-containing protein [Pseudomonas sp. SZ57]|nr:DUF1534 domain-containing protein [Pseudomonas sp. SZ57]
MSGFPPAGSQLAQHLSATGRLVPGRQSTPVDDRDPAAGLSQSAPHRTSRIGRRASRNAYPRGAWARWCSCGRLSFLTLQRGNAVGDALRHRYAPHRTSRIGRGASHDTGDYEQPQQSGSSAV